MTKIFISYTHADRAVAEEISQALRSASIEHWIDFERIELGENFIDRMDAGLSAADYIVLLHSATSAESRFVKAEWSAAMARGAVIVPLRLDDTDVPTLLQPVQYIDMRRDRQSGLKSLVNFFKEENTSVAPVVLGTELTDPVVPEMPKRLLRLAAQTCIEEQDYHSVLLDFDYSENDIPGNSLGERITRLLLKMRRDGLEREFRDWMVREPRLRRCLTRVVNDQ